MDVKTFAEAAKISTNNLSRCVDGRYEGLEPFPAIAKPGADAGDVMVAFAALNLLKTKLSNDQVMAAVVDLAGGMSNFRFHSDEHAEHDELGAGMGCGHIKQAKLDPAAYGLTQDQIEFLLEQLPRLLTAGAHQEVLKGNHAEQAVVVVNSQSYSIKPLLRDGNELKEAFVYQKTIHGQQLEKLARQLQSLLESAGQKFEINQVHSAVTGSFQKQLTETLKRLASNLETVEITIDGSGQVS